MLDAKKPYASEITGAGSRPEAPWVTREEFERITNIIAEDHGQLRNQVLDNTNALKGNECGLRTWAEIKVETLAWMADGRMQTIEARLARLEAVGEGDGWRVSSQGDYFRLWDGKKMWARRKTEERWFVDCAAHHTPEIFADYELHGPERARIVREFLEWKGAQ